MPFRTGVRRLIRLTGTLLFLILLFSAPGLIVRAPVVPPEASGEPDVLPENAWLLPLYQGENENLFLRPLAPVSLIRDAVRDIQSGEFLYYPSGNMRFPVKRDFPRFAEVTLKLLLYSSLIASGLGLVLGMLISVRKWAVLSRILDYLSSIPDFILILLLQLLTVIIYQTFGFRLTRISFVNAARGDAYLLPLFVLTLLSLAYLTRSAYRYTEALRREKFLLVPLAAGCPPTGIYLGHILPGVIRMTESDIHRSLIISIGHLFILERMFNIPGLTRALFQAGFTHYYSWNIGYRYFSANANVLLISFLGILAGYMLALAGVKALFFLIQKGARYGV